MSKKSLENDWEADEDVRTLQRAREITKDTKRFDKAKKKAKEMLKASQEAVNLINNIDKKG